MAIPTLSTLPGEEAATGIFLPETMSAVLELAEQGAGEYLGRQVTRLVAQGLSATAEISRGDPATAIAETAQRAGSDLIVMATHGKAGMEAFWEGSVAPKVSSRSSLPILLVPVHATARQATV